MSGYADYVSDLACYRGVEAQLVDMAFCYFYFKLVNYKVKYYYAFIVSDLCLNDPVWFMEFEWDRCNPGILRLSPTMAMA